MEELLSLKWNNHSSTFFQVLCNIRNQHQYSDVTLICEEKYYKVHRMVLSTCSDYFKNMFDRLGHHQSLVIVLNDIKSEHFNLLLDYMYLGEVNVKQGDLTALIKTSEFLQIKGLAVADEEPTTTSQPSLKRDLESPTAKRKKKMKKTDSFKPTLNTDLFKITESASSVSFHQESAPIIKEVEEIEQSISDTVKEEPAEFSPEEIFVDNGYKQQSSSPEAKEESESKQITEYESHPDSQLQESLTMEDSNFSSSSFQEAPTNWEDSNLRMDFRNQSLPSTTDTANPLKMKEFVCCYCSKTYPWRSYLESHMRIHTGERPYPCHLCTYQATQKYALNRHIVLKHKMRYNENS